MNCIIESGTTLTPAQELHLQSFSISAPKRLNAQAVGLTQVTRIPELKHYCAQQRLNFAQLKIGESLNDYQLLAMDMDSTLINIECIDEIADFLNLKIQVKKITDAAMAGEIDFVESLTARVLLLAGLEARVLELVYTQRLRINPGAEALLKQCQAQGLRTLLVSGGFTFFTERLKARLDLDYAYANQLEVENGKLTGCVFGPIIDAKAKAQKLTEVAQQLQIPLSRTIAMGDGANDATMLQTAGLGVAYCAKPGLRDVARININQDGLDGVQRLLAYNQVASAPGLP